MVEGWDWDGLDVEGRVDERGEVRVVVLVLVDVMVDREMLSSVEAHVDGSGGRTKDVECRR